MASKLETMDQKRSRGQQITLFVSPSRPAILHNSRYRGDTVRAFSYGSSGFNLAWPPLKIKGGGEGYLEFLDLVINFGLDGRCL
jgi:hypothetical protein